MKPSPHMASRAVFDAILRSDLYAYLQAIFPIVSPGRPLLKNWHLEALAHRLELVRTGKIKRLNINVPPRTLKSIIASVAFPSFALGHSPTLRIVCVSYAESLAKKHADDCRLLMKHERYQRLFPGTIIRDTKDTQLDLGTTAGGMRLATSVGGTLTGRGGNIIIIDDPIKPADAHSATARDNVTQWFGHTLLSRLDYKSEDAIILVMQRVHLDDLAGHLIEQGGWDVLSLPAIAEIDELIPLTTTINHHRRIGDVLHPARESLADLEALKREMGTMDFNAQYQQAPVPLQGNLIRWTWFGVYDTLLPPRPEDRLIVSWDTAMSGKELSDFSAGVVLYGQGENLYIVEVIRERLEFPALKRRVIEQYRRYRTWRAHCDLVIEDKGSGMSLIQQLRADGIYPRAFAPEGTDKVVRMAGQCARLEAGRVFIPRSAAWLADFKAELLAFPVGRHDDQVDALSQALIYHEQKRRSRIRFGVLKGQI